MTTEWEEFESSELRLGEATVNVEYAVIDGQVFIQGTEINGEWVDVDCFSLGVKNLWRQEIERKLGIES